MFLFNLIGRLIHWNNKGAIVIEQIEQKVEAVSRRSDYSTISDEERSRRTKLKKQAKRMRALNRVRS
jgi:hypothetical protein